MIDAIRNATRTFRLAARRGLALAALAVALLAVTMTAGPTAQAQEAPEYGYVDLVLDVEAERRTFPTFTFTVRNVGTATAVGVTVSFLLEDFEVFNNDFDGASITGNEVVDTTNQRFTWEVGTIPAGETSSQLEFSVELHPGHRTPFDPTSGYWIGSATATASAVSPEPDTLLANNVIRRYLYYGVHVSGIKNRLMNDSRL